MEVIPKIQFPCVAFAYVDIYPEGGAASHLLRVIDLTRTEHGMLEVDTAWAQSPCASFCGRVDHKTIYIRKASTGSMSRR